MSSRGLLVTHRRKRPGSAFTHRFQTPHPLRGYKLKKLFIIHGIYLRNERPLPGQGMPALAFRDPSILQVMYIGSMPTDDTSSYPTE